jgi:hypothetical protein
MQIVLLNGGLANQTFQYLFGMALQARSNEIVVFDDSYFDWITKSKPHSNNANSQRRLLNKIFNLDVRQLSSFFNQESWNEMLAICHNENISMVQLLKNNGLDFKLIAETEDYKFNGKVIKLSEQEWLSHYFPNEEIYYHGYWINNNAFKMLNASSLLKFSTITEPHNLEYAANISLQDTVGIHVRRFSLEGFNWDLPASWYHQSKAKLKEQNSDFKFFIFSDDLEWCNQNLHNLGLTSEDKVTFVSGNENEELNYRDLQLLSMAHHLIISNSSFSYLAALLNTRNGIVLNPTARNLN